MAQITTKRSSHKFGLANQLRWFSNACTMESISAQSLLNIFSYTPNKSWNPLAGDLAIVLPLHDPRIVEHDICVKYQYLINPQNWLPRIPQVYIDCILLSYSHVYASIPLTSMPHNASASNSNSSTISKFTVQNPSPTARSRPRSKTCTHRSLKILLSLNSGGSGVLVASDAARIR